MLTPQTPITDFPRLGKRLAPRLKKLGIKTIADLLWYLPTRYEDLSEVTSIVDVHPSDTKVTVRGQITLLRSRRSFKRRMMVTELQIEDGSGSLQAVWFQQPYVAKTLQTGDEIFLSGVVKESVSGQQMINPNYEKVKEETLHTGRIVPLYNLTTGVSHKQLRFLIHEALGCVHELQETLPPEIIQQEEFPSLPEALLEIHFPHDWKSLERAEQRLKFEELFWLQIKILYGKREYDGLRSTPITAQPPIINQFLGQLPFTLTDDQQTSLQEVITDLGKTRPMNRLLEGDVGSGKTIVAAAASYLVTSAGHQVAIMAATEILAQQHFKNFIRLMPDRTIALLTSKQRFLSDGSDYGEVSRATIIKNIDQGNISIVIGTHSLIQEDLVWSDLGLAVIDEQHRFGVAQRQKLRHQTNNKTAPHLLSLTATPIPRTLALTLYGDLDISLIKSKPANRQPVITKIVDPSNRPKAYDWLHQKMKQGEQLFIICPLVEASDKLAVKSVMTEYERLKADVYPQLDIRYLHGKMKSEDKDRVISDFRDKKFPLLVASSVVEVGIDIPGATMMVIEGAERFGLAQLHQFRGRIGRNDLPAYCFLFTSEVNHQNRERLQALVKHTDGFELAEIDLQLRGAGDVFGTQQSGLVDLRVARLTDVEMIKVARSWAERVLNEPEWKQDTELQNKITDVVASVHWE